MSKNNYIYYSLKFSKFFNIFFYLKKLVSAQKLINEKKTESPSLGFKSSSSKKYLKSPSPKINEKINLKSPSSNLTLFNNMEVSLEGVVCGVTYTISAH